MTKGGSFLTGRSRGNQNAVQRCHARLTPGINRFECISAAASSSVISVIHIYIQAYICIVFPRMMKSVELYFFPQMSHFVGA